MKKQKAILFGPFFGEVSWEYYRFAPYAIYSKKIYTDSKIIVLTREDRFDFYGQCADVLIPLKIKDEHIYQQKAFKLFGYDLELCKRFEDIFKSQYMKHYQILDHHCPDISSLRYNLKWQFPRDKMNYDFRPRKSNYDYIKKIYKKLDNLIFVDGYDYTTTDYMVINTNTLKRIINEDIKNGKNISYYGCLVVLLKYCKFVVSNLYSDVGRLALLLRKPLIYPDRDISTDNVNLLNPYNTIIVDCENIEEGIKLYEDYI